MATGGDPLQALLAAGAIETGPFDANSRYRGVALGQMTQADGAVIAYLRRRFIPDPSRFPVLGSYEVKQGDRYDLIAARVFGDALLWWRLADANRVLDPRELTAAIGRRLLVTAEADPAGGGS